MKRHKTKPVELVAEHGRTRKTEAKKVDIRHDVDINRKMSTQGNPERLIRPNERKSPHGNARQRLKQR